MRVRMPPIRSGGVEMRSDDALSCIGGKVSFMFFLFLFLFLLVISFSYVKGSFWGV